MTEHSSRPYFTLPLFKAIFCWKYQWSRFFTGKSSQVRKAEVTFAHAQSRGRVKYDRPLCSVIYQTKRTKIWLTDWIYILWPGRMFYCDKHIVNICDNVWHIHVLHRRRLLLHLFVFLEISELEHFLHSLRPGTVCLLKHKDWTICLYFLFHCYAIMYSWFSLLTIYPKFSNRTTSCAKATSLH